MDLKTITLTEEMTVGEVLKKIEKYRHKILYVIKNKKLESVISEGDIRRFILNGGDINNSMEKVKNYNPAFIYKNQKKDAKRIMQEKKVGELPVLNFNDEFEEVIFYNLESAISDKKINVPVVIMAGGLGTRLYPYTKILPKPLIPIGETPISEYILNSFNKYGCTEFYMILNHKRNMIKAYFDSIEKKYELNYIDEEIPLGTGGGLSLLKRNINEDFFFTNCDILIDINYIDLYEYHKENNNFITIVCAKKYNKIPYGVVKTDEVNNYLGMKEKPEYEFMVNTGLYVVNNKVIDELQENKEIGFPDIIDIYKKQGKKIGVYPIKEEAFMDMGEFKEMKKMLERLNI